MGLTKRTIRKRIIPVSANHFPASDHRKERAFGEKYEVHTIAKLIIVTIM
jgi:hypothetical protein